MTFGASALAQEAAAGAAPPDRAERSAAGLYDAANAAARTGELGKAILGYQRAALLAPRDPDIAANLAAVRSQAGLRTRPVSWLERAARWLSVVEWTAVAVGSLWLLCASAAAAGLDRRRRQLWLGIATAAALAFIAGGAGFVATSLRQRTCVVTAKGGADLLLSPFEGAASQGRLTEGETVHTDSRHGSFLHVRDGDGQQGWLDSAAVEPLVPGTS